MAKKKITTNKQKNKTIEQKRAAIVKRSTEFDPEDYSVKYCLLRFIVNKQAKGLSEATLNGYKNFSKKLEAFCDKFGGADEISISIIEDTEIMQEGFRLSLGNVSVQTINHYLRIYRAFGNYCLEEGYVENFNCPIKEVEPPAKEVYTDKEIEKLTAKPNRSNFLEFRDYMIILTLLGTGARSETIRNIKVKDVDLEGGYISFNALKSKKTNRIGLEKKLHRELKLYIAKLKEIEEQCDIEIEYLFCSQYGEQLKRNGLYRAVSNYNKSRGVKKTSLHLFRHTYAKTWITSGGDIVSLSKVLNHSELEMVKRYANLYATDVKDEIEQHSILSHIERKSGKTIR